MSHTASTVTLSGDSTVQRPWSSARSGQAIWFLLGSSHSLMLALCFFPHQLQCTATDWWPGSVSFTHFLFRMAQGSLSHHNLASTDWYMKNEHSESVREHMNLSSKHLKSQDFVVCSFCVQIKLHKNVFLWHCSAPLPYNPSRQMIQIKLGDDWKCVFMISEWNYWFSNNSITSCNSCMEEAGESKGHSWHLETGSRTLLCPKDRLVRGDSRGPKLSVSTQKSCWCFRLMGRWTKLWTAQGHETY